MNLKKLELTTLRALGCLGVLLALIVFIRAPSFPTPDKLIVFLTLLFMALGETTEMLKRLLPFTAIILIYEQFRGLAHHLNAHVNYTVAPAFDKWLFHVLPTQQLQAWWWHGTVRWFDFVFYITYMLFFVVPFSLAILVWKTRPKFYWQGVMGYSLVFYGAFLTFLIFPASPPWMTAQQHLGEPVARVSSSVWSALGIHDFPSIYNVISPNPVAAVPSLHAACATLFSIYIFKLYGRRWGLLSLIYPALIYVGVVYQGEHYVFDVLLGGLYAWAAYRLAPWALRRTARVSRAAYGWMLAQKKRVKLSL